MRRIPALGAGKRRWPKNVINLGAGLIEFPPAPGLLLLDDDADDDLLSKIPTRLEVRPRA